MPLELRRGYADLITSGGQLVLLFIAVKLHSRTGWIICAVLIASLSLFAWVSAWRRARAISDTPTSKIASAAQGYTELRGIGRPLAGLPLVSPLNGLPCLWYRYSIERRDNDKWVHDEDGESDSSFILDDGSAQCLVDPEGAEMLVTGKDTWTSGDRRYTQWLLVARESIYALGQFSTRGSVDLELDTNEDVKQLLAEWKKEPQRLLARFDLNRDGQLDIKEWELARQQARREVAANHRELRTHAELNVLRRPEDGRLYLISDLDQDRLARRYRLWSFAHLAIFFGALMGFGLAMRLV